MEDGDEEDMDDDESVSFESLRDPTSTSSSKYGDLEVGAHAFMALQSATLALVAESAGTQRMLFNWVERWSRMVNAAPTPAELYALRNPGLTMSDKLAKDFMKVHQNFGRPQGCHTNARRALKELSENGEFLVGGFFKVNSPAFTLCKHLVVSSRAGTPLVENAVLIGCSCLPETACTPFGCRHTEVTLFKEHPPNAYLCGHCSQCLRCGKLLGLLVVLVWHAVIVLEPLTCLPPACTTPDPEAVQGGCDERQGAAWIFGKAEGGNTLLL